MRIQRYCNDEFEMVHIQKRYKFRRRIILYFIIRLVRIGSVCVHQTTIIYALERRAVRFCFNTSICQKSARSIVRYALSIGSFKQGFGRIEEFLQIDALLYKWQRATTHYHSRIPPLALAYPACRNRTHSWTRASSAPRTPSKDPEILLSEVGGSQPRSWRVLPKNGSIEKQDTNSI